MILSSWIHPIRSGRTEEIVHFGYRDFKYRLGRM